MKSKTKIEKQTQRKSNPEITETVVAAKKSSSNSETWKEIAEELSSPRKKQLAVNLDKIDESLKEMKGEEKVIVIPGKVLSMGNLNSLQEGKSKKLKIAALKFSETAKEKLLNSNCEVFSILEEIKQNPQAKEVKIIKK